MLLLVKARHHGLQSWTAEVDGIHMDALEELEAKLLESAASVVRRRRIDAWKVEDLLDTLSLLLQVLVSTDGAIHTQLYCSRRFSISRLHHNTLHILVASCLPHFPDLCMRIALSDRSPIILQLEVLPAQFLRVKRESPVQYGKVDGKQAIKLLLQRPQRAVDDLVLVHVQLILQPVCAVHAILRDVSQTLRNAFHSCQRSGDISAPEEVKALDENLLAVHVKLRHTVQRQLGDHLLLTGGGHHSCGRLGHAQLLIGDPLHVELQDYENEFVTKPQPRRLPGKLGILVGHKGSLHLPGVHLREHLHESLMVRPSRILARFLDLLLGSEHIIRQGPRATEPSTDRVHSFERCISLNPARLLSLRKGI
mmetsp:Transcript_10307/g.24793  ORF Transcript_10307/g.24793 Transcript_10307/m.24793 type:complete len:366 (+) Transcript_10307:235-1332(+)